MKTIALALLLLLTQVVCSETSPATVEGLEEGVSYAFPFVYEDDEDVGERESNNDSPKDEPPSAWQGKLGKGKLTVDVENTDFLSQRQAEWDKIQEKNKPKKKKKSRFKKDEDEEEKKDHSPRVSIKWSTEN